MRDNISIEGLRAPRAHSLATPLAWTEPKLVDPVSKMICVGENETNPGLLVERNRASQFFYYHLRILKSVQWAIIEGIRGVSRARLNRLDWAELWEKFGAKFRPIMQVVGNYCDPFIFISYLFIGGKIKYTIKNNVISWQEDTSKLFESALYHRMETANRPLGHQASSHPIN